MKVVANRQAETESCNSVLKEMINVKLKANACWLSLVFCLVLWAGVCGHVINACAFAFHISRPVREKLYLCRMSGKAR